MRVIKLVMDTPYKNIGHYLNIDTAHIRNIILIAGATASGKSSVALSLARKLNGVIVNADSMQVYRELQIISARPTLEDEKQAEHRLFGSMSAAQDYSVGHWLEQVSREIVDILKRGKIPIIVGGTGLYFNALVDGISPIPNIKADIRQFWRAEAKLIDNENLHKRLADVDFELSERLEINDVQRVIRGLEVFHSTGRTLSDWQQNEPLKQFLPKMVGLNLHKFILCPERQYLYDRINARFDIMLELGGLDEVKQIMSMGLAADKTALKAIGVRQMNEALIGNMSMGEAIEKSKTESRRFAKRQMTWQKSNLITYNCVFEQQTTRQVSFILSKISFSS